MTRGVESCRFHANAGFNMVDRGDKFGQCAVLF